jgi:hypothetical protein
MNLSAQHLPSGAICKRWSIEWAVITLNAHGINLCNEMAIL